MDVDKLINRYYSWSYQDIKDCKGKRKSYITGVSINFLYILCIYLGVCLCMNHNRELMIHVSKSDKFVIVLFLLIFVIKNILDTVLLEIWYKKNVTPKLLRQEDKVLDSSILNAENELSNLQQYIDELEDLDSKINEIKSCQGQYYKEEYINGEDRLIHPMCVSIPDSLVDKWNYERDCLINKIDKF